MAVGIFAILDDVALLLDDAAVMSKVAAKKTAGILGDDLAVNAEKATGFHASRELPVIWAITKGSLRNKLIILPVAFLLSYIAPWAITPILLFGGAYLCYEGAEKVYEWIVGHEHHKVAATHLSDPDAILQQEQNKIASAIRTDFILSIEIVIIALGTVATQALGVQILVVSFIALLATIGVYALVALLVRMDDAGLYLIARAKEQKDMSRRLGELLVAALPKIVRALGVVGTFAMLLVGGGIYAHNIAWIHHALHLLPSLLADLIVGLAVGLLVFAFVSLFQKRFAKQQGES